MTCCQLATSATYCHLCAHSKQRWQWLVVNRVSLCVYRHGHHGTRAGYWWFSGQPSFHTNPSSASQGPGTYETILSDHPQQSTVLTRCGLPWSPRELAWYQSSSGSMPPEVAVDSSTSQTQTSNSTVLHAFMGKCKHFMCNTYRGIIRTISEDWEKESNCWFKLTTVRRQIWGNNHLSCSFGLLRSHLA